MKSSGCEEADDEPWGAELKVTALAAALSCLILSAVFRVCGQMFNTAQCAASRAAPGGQLALSPAASLVFKSEGIATDFCRDLAKKTAAWRSFCDWGLILFLVVINTNLSTMLRPEVAAACHTEKQKFRLLLLMLMLLKLAWLRGGMRDMRTSWAANALRLLAFWVLMIHSYMDSEMPCVAAQPLAAQPCWRMDVTLVGLFSVLNAFMPVGGRLAPWILIAQIVCAFTAVHLLNASSTNLECRYRSGRSVMMVAALSINHLANYASNQRSVMRYIETNAHIFS